MPVVGKSLGPYLAVRNKMPKPLPPNIPDITPIVSRSMSTASIITKTSPSASCSVGTEDMDDEKLAQNIKAVISAVTAALPRGRDNVREYLVKTTMGKPVKIVM